MKSNKLLSMLSMLFVMAVLSYGCGETQPNPLAGLDTQLEGTSSSQDNNSASSSTSSNTNNGQPIVAKALAPNTNLSGSSVLSISMGHDPGSASKKGEILPENHDPNEQPHETLAVTMVITDVRLVTAVLDAGQNEQWTVTKDVNGNVTSASLNTLAGSTDIILLQNGTQRKAVYGCGNLTFADPTLPAPTLDCDFNNVLQVATIPVQDAVTRADQSKRYNGVLVKYTKGSIEITDNFVGLVSQNCGTTPNCKPAAEIKMPIMLAPNANPDNNPKSSLDDYLQADVGQFFIPITNPQVFGNAVYKLRIDPFSQLGPTRAAAFNPGQGTDIWQVIISGGVEFQSLAPSAEVPLGTKTEGGTVASINNPFAPEGSLTDESGQNLALPNHDITTYWFQPTQQKDQIGTVGAQILVCTTNNCDSAGVDSASTSVLNPTGSVSFCSGKLIDKIACQSRAVDGAFAGTPQTITGNVILLTTPNPDFSGLLGFGTLAFRTPTVVQITEVAQTGNQPPQ